MLKLNKMQCKIKKKWHKSSRKSRASSIDIKINAVRRKNRETLTGKVVKGDVQLSASEQGLRLPVSRGRVHGRRVSVGLREGNVGLLLRCGYLLVDGARGGEQPLGRNDFGTLGRSLFIKPSARAGGCCWRLDGDLLFVAAAAGVCRFWAVTRTRLAH